MKLVGAHADYEQHPAMTLPFLKAEKDVDAEHRRDVSYVPPCEYHRLEI